MNYICVERIGSLIHHYYIDDFGKFHKAKCSYKPIIFEYRNEVSEWKDIYDINVTPVQVDNIHSYSREYQDVKNHAYAGDVADKYQFISDMYPNDITYDRNNFVISYTDIEVDSSSGFPEPDKAQNEILSIACYIENEDVCYVFGSKQDYTPPSTNIKHIFIENEKERMQQFLTFLKKKHVHFLITWNGTGFDIPYIINRCMQLGIEIDSYLPMGKFNEVFVKDMALKTYEIPGIVHYDYMRMLKKFQATKMESYSLNFAATEILGEGKSDFSNEGNLQNLYATNYQGFIDYNINDTRLIREIDKKKQLIDLMIQLAYKAKCNLGDVFSSQKQWDCLIYNELKNHKIVVPKRDFFEGTKKKDEILGAYVHAPDKGLVEWIVPYDFASLYPNIMISYNLSPSTLISEKNLPQELKDLKKQVTIDKIVNDELDLSLLKKYNVCMSGAGHFFKKDKLNHFCQIVENIYKERKDLKKKANEVRKLKGECDEYRVMEHKTWALKILINSLYGCLGNQYFRFYNREVAESITMTGQVIIKTVRKHMDEYYKKQFNIEEGVKYIDTDAAYISFNPFIERAKEDLNKDLGIDVKSTIEFIYKVSEKVIYPKLIDSTKIITDRMNVYKNSLVMAREKICKSMLFLTKKRYIMFVVEDDGFIYDKPKLVIKGIEVIKSSTPSLIREVTKDIIYKIMDTNNQSLILDEIKKFKQKYKSVEDLNTICFPRGVSEVSKYYNASTGFFHKKCPINVRAAILFNRYIEKFNITHKYPSIKDGERIYFIYLKLPNPLKDNVIGFPTGYDLPSEFNIHSFIDYDTQFEKSFVKIVGEIFDSLSWELNIDNKKKLF